MLSRNIHTILFFPLLIITLLFTSCAEESKSTASKPPAENKPKTSMEEKAPPHPYEKEIKQWSKMDGLNSTCSGSKTNLAVPVNVIAANISKDSLAYNVEPFSDCSGIFLRFLDSLETRCPNHNFPDPETYRDSRALAKWYHEQGQLIRITDPLNMMKYIKPGAVMFYGARGTENTSLSLDDLFRHGGINHVGVVTEIKTEGNEEVSGYSLFHGQRPGKLASITRYHKRTYRNRPEYPPYGNGTEQWVAVAPILATEDAVFGGE